MTRYDVINRFIQSRHYKSFLEIGTAQGETFRNVSAVKKASVDPDPMTGPTYLMTSDEFFCSCPDMFDVIFIDGLHECHQVYKDIQNGLAHLNHGGVIIAHDCLPISYVAQMPRRKPQESVMVKMHRPWQGDCWKAIVKARTVLPYEIFTVDTDLGCAVIDTANSKSTFTDDLPDDMDDMTYTSYCMNCYMWMVPISIDAFETNIRMTQKGG